MKEIPDLEKFTTGDSVKISYFRTNTDLRYQNDIHGNLFEQVAKTKRNTNFAPESIFQETVFLFLEIEIDLKALVKRHATTAKINPFLHKVVLNRFNCFVYSVLYGCLSAK